MFRLIEITRRIKIEPRFFNPTVDLNKILILVVNKFMANQVIPGAGLFIMLTSIEHAEVMPAIMNNADIFVRLTFQCLVFTLLEGETIKAKVKESTPQGCKVVLPFYRSIHIDPNYLPTPSKFDFIGKRWLWIKKLGVDEYFFSINVGEELCMRVIGTKFNKLKKRPNDTEKCSEPMLTNGSIAQELLGPVVWWSG